MNYYPFHIGDYASHTAHLEPMEDLAYRRLLDLYYLSEGALPADVQTTAKLIRMRSCAADVESVLKDFFTLTPDGWRHERCEEEIESMREKQQKQRERANKRWHKPDADAGNAESQSHGNADAMQHCNAVALETDAAASISHAVAMPPTPTPTPTPISMRRGARLPQDWSPSDEDMAFAKHLLNGRSDSEVSKFRDYWTAQPGQKGVKLDWSATWRNWCRNAAEYAGKSIPAKSGSIFDGAL